MAEQVLMVKCSLDDIEGAIDDELSRNGIDLDDTEFESLVEQFPESITFKVYFDDEDIDNTFDIIDEDWG